ncbi:RagB/SusD family nutrient uptake outer membrane protein [Aquimarina brevivitae]|uniref:RagB/SusD domain-containing protein n=1 Tax=Aquimarina brevivitae TaxID=323412 RepID=A0A4Q7PK31_9FLAO|nr:RagB/SusD family nutrient uptake outer membrane protein [Aquimarina brevivitae]RZT00201.1 RagB/SusD domain-containing protein [Aquimarina brevivitae]
MKNFKYIITLTLFATLLLSCEERLDIDPQQALTNEDAFDTADKISNILIGAYAQAGQAASYGGQITIITELLGNNGELQWNGTFTDQAEFDAKNVSTTNETVAAYWLNSYSIINQANIVLDNLDVFENESQRNSVEGQARFLRAVTYFDLVRLFAKPNNGGINNLEDGVPIVVNPVTTYADIEFPERDTIEDVYNFITIDLQEAALLLPISNRDLASANAAKALLARVSLQTGNYESARDLANEVISSGYFRLESSLFDVYNNQDNSSEDVFAWQVTESDGSNALNTFWATDRFGGRPGNPDISIENPFFGIFDTFFDARANFFYVDNETGSGIATYKYISGVANIPYIRLAELYLIRAESNFILGTSVGNTPLNDVNIIRTRAGIFSLTSLRYVDIILERLKELSFEGNKLHDYRRLQIPIGELEYDSPRLVLPIPQRERNVNPNLSQNDGY